MNRLLLGDNLALMQQLLPELSDRVMLAYLDPPFFTGRQHMMTDGRLAFDDRWKSRDEYLSTLDRRLWLVRRLLDPAGSMIIHVDAKTSHYVKVLCDQIFGEDAFASEIIWRYRRWPSKSSNFQRVHDVLLRYRKDPKTPPRWNQLYEPLAASTTATWGSSKQRAVVDADGRRSRSSKTEEKSRGVPMGDVWDIGIVAPCATERTGYPTQKPEALLERIISSLSNAGDVVLDPYAGSGTTLSAAARLGRAFVGIDSSLVAFDVARDRLRSAGVAVSHVRAA